MDDVDELVDRLVVLVELFDLCVLLTPSVALGSVVSVVGAIMCAVFVCNCIMLVCLVCLVRLVRLVGAVCTLCTLRTLSTSGWSTWLAELLIVAFYYIL